MIMNETVRLRLVFEERHILGKSKKKEGLNRSWVLLKPQHKTISDLTSHLIHTFRLNRSCPYGIILSMDGFVLPPFESTCILKDKDFISVRKKGSISADNAAAELASAPHCSTLVLKHVNNVDQGEGSGGYTSEPEANDNEPSEDTMHVENTPDRDTVSKKRKGSKKLRDSKKKKRKLSIAEELPLISEAHKEDNGSFSDGRTQAQLSIMKKDKPCNSSGKHDKSSSLEVHRQSNKINGSMANGTSFCQPQENGKGNMDVSNTSGGAKKLPSRSARRKKAKRQWLRQQVKIEKEEPSKSQKLEEDVQQLPDKDNGKALAVHAELLGDSDVEDDVVPVVIRPGHIRFEPLRKDADQAAQQNQLPLETFQWNGITSKKKGQKWGKEKSSFFKRNDQQVLNQECTPVLPIEEEKHVIDPMDFDKFAPYTSLPKEGDIIAYCLIELSESWTPEMSSFRVGEISQYDPELNRIKLVPVSEYPLDFKNEMDEEPSSVQQDTSFYSEDGTLEIDYSSLLDVRMVKHGNLDSVRSTSVGGAVVDSAKAAGGKTDEFHVDSQVSVSSCKQQNTPEVHAPAQEKGEVNVWDEINQALNAKKAQLSQEDGWSKKESPGTRSWSNRSLRGSALGPTMAILRAQNGL
ncbi:Coilin [Quillaja saponaria]|uniref:Coilin n=1 Tax=Quillaja saponaria TaxID=32244 RepID=A0AAD7P7Y3_QUISA|nr:Coilin [Quillaja saponaria]